MRIAAADLFCGAGGTSSGLVAACQALGLDVDLVAVDHWQVAIETHSANLPGARHICARIEAVNPREVVPGGYLRLLCASPECTHHSVARGGRPVSDQARAGAWEIVRWASELFVENILVENVPEFRAWGPVGRRGRPLKSGRGKTFAAWVAALKNLGYAVEWRVLCAADFGDPTTRRRLFVQATRGREAIAWPEPTHNETGDGLARWRAAREVIDWGMRGQSIFDRKRPLAAATLRRIETGLRRFGGESAGPWIEALRAGKRQRCDGRAMGAMVIGQQSCAAARDVGAPVPTVSCAGAIALVEPFLVRFQGSHAGKADADRRVLPLGRPAPTLDTSNRLGLVEPMMADILFRMLQPAELAQAQGFPQGYQFSGNKGDVVRQIGNAVPHNTARALCEAILRRTG
mgnify:FL=1